MKTSVINYDFYENPSQSVVNHGAKFHIRIRNYELIDLNEIGDRLVRSSTATKIDVAAVITGIREVIVDELSKGNVISIDGICKIEPILGVVDGVCNGTEKGNQIQLKALRTHTVKSLVEDVKTRLKPCSRMRGKHSPGMSETEVADWLEEFFKTHEFVSRRQLEEGLGLTHYMASKFLKRFVTDGKLYRPGRQTDSLYMPVRDMSEASDRKD